MDGPSRASDPGGPPGPRFGNVRADVPGTDIDSSLTLQRIHYGEIKGGVMAHSDTRVQTLIGGIKPSPLASLPLRFVLGGDILGRLRDEDLKPDLYE